MKASVLSSSSTGSTRVPASSLPRRDESALLRGVLAFDATTCLVLGIALLGAGNLAARITGLPAGLLVDAAWVLIAFGTCVGWAAARAAPARWAVSGIIGLNVLWTLASVGYGLLGAVGATSLGRAAVIGQGIAVGVLAVLEFVAWRRTRA